MQFGFRLLDWWAIYQTTSRKLSIADPVNGKTVHCSTAFVWALNSCFRLMVLLDLTTGLRRSELLALKWRDEDFSRLELSVVPSIYLRENLSVITTLEFFEHHFAKVGHRLAPYDPTSSSRHCCRHHTREAASFKRGSRKPRLAQHSTAPRFLQADLTSPFIGLLWPGLIPVCSSSDQIAATRP